MMVYQLTRLRHPPKSKLGEGMPVVFGPPCFALFVTSFGMDQGATTSFGQLWRQWRH